jgi:hypothetical protein
VRCKTHARNPPNPEDTPHLTSWDLSVLSALHKENATQSAHAEQPAKTIALLNNLYIFVSYFLYGFYLICFFIVHNLQKY